MDSRPRFSIVMPVYNVAPYLEDSLGSVTAQVCDDYEVVLVDDGSTDGSGARCDAFAAERPGRVTVVHQENQGLLMARRAGLARARGAYIVTLDSDDCLRADALSVLSDAIERWEPDIIAFEYSRSERFRPYGPAALGLEPGLYGEDRYVELERLVCRGYHNNLWSKAFRRRVVDIDADYSAHRGMTHAEDLLQLLPVVDRGRTFAACAEPLYYYRPNPGSATKSYRPRQLDDLEVALGSLVAYADAWGGACPELARRSALLQCGYLLHMLVADGSDKPVRRVEFDRLGAYAHEAGLFGPWMAGLRVDKRKEAEALQAGDYERACRIVRAFELAKRVRDLGASWR